MNIFRNMKGLFLVFLLFLSVSGKAQGPVYAIDKGNVTFFSEAKEELIKATSGRMSGAVNLQKKTFYFKIDIGSFIGFNNPLQKEHFNENYLETDLFPTATFSGKIIEDLDLTKNGEYDIRAKGKLKIHGVELDRIIKVHVSSKNGTLIAKSGFVVTLSDHNIKVPRIVYDKLSPEINVSVNASFIAQP